MPSFRPDQMTAFDRMKKNGGFIAGPDNPMSNAMMERNEEMGAEPEEEEAPPNLRDSGDENPTCGNCKNYTARTCTLYGGYDVRPSEVCDSHEFAGSEEEEAPPMPEMPEPEEEMEAA